MICLKVRINPYFSIRQQNINIFTQKTLHYHLNYYTAYLLSKLVKMWMFLETFAMKSAIFFWWNEGGMYGLVCKKKIFFANLLRGHYLFEALHTWPTVKSSKNMVKSGSKMTCVKIFFLRKYFIYS